MLTKTFFLLRFSAAGFHIIEALAKKRLDNCLQRKKVSKFSLESDNQSVSKDTAMNS